MKTKFILLLFCISVSLLCLSHGRADWHDALPVTGRVQTGTWQAGEEAVLSPLAEEGESGIAAGDAKNFPIQGETSREDGGIAPGVTGLVDAGNGQPCLEEPGPVSAPLPGEDFHERGPQEGGIESGMETKPAMGTSGDAEPFIESPFSDADPGAGKTGSGSAAGSPEPDIPSPAASGGSPTDPENTE